MNRVLVTGAAGFLGFHLARALALRDDTTVLCVDNFVRGERDHHYAALSRLPNVECYDIDLTDAAGVALLPGGIDQIYHLAALNGTQNFYERPLEVVRCCTLPTMHLWERYGPRKLNRFVYAGTSESYASTVSRFGWEVPTGEEVPLGIADVSNPRWSYAISKTHGEVVTIQAGRSFGVPFSIIRYHNAYGPRMGDKHVVPDFLNRARHGRYVLFGHADTRSFIYVDDAVEATLRIGEEPACRGEIINVGGALEIDMHSLALRMMALNGMTGAIELHPSPAGSVGRRAPKLDKLKRLTGFVERWTLDEGLAATSRFYLHDELVERRPLAHDKNADQDISAIV